MTLHMSSRRAKRRWALLGGIVGVLTIVGALITLAAPLDKTLFELDGDATNDTTYTKVGVLNAAVAAAAGPTAITICQNPATFADGTKILVDAERMTLNGGANAGGGGCPSDFPLKRSYSATRGVDGTSPGAHAKAEDVSLITTGTFSGPDWDQVYANIQDDEDSKCDSAALIDLGAVECTFSHDGRAESVFTQAKDYDEISDTSGVWKWRDQSVPDANELDDGMAVKYIDGSGDQHLYFAADRFATNGTKDAGFWFFHKEVGALAPVGSSDGLFSGTHTAPDPGGNGVFCGSSLTPNCAPYDADDTAGDVLILTTFTGGGATTTVRVFEWIGPSGSTAALLERGVQGDCVGGAANQELCATVNKTTVETAWPYSGKSEPANDQVASGGFLEGGVNLTALGLEGCFSSFMATSRSSAELTADLKDFILGDFEACDTEVTTTPSNAMSPPAALVDTDDDDIPDIQIGTGSAGVDVSDALVLNVKGTTTFTGTLNFFLCGPIAETETCDEDGVEIGAAAGTNPVTANGTYYSATANLTEVGYYCWRGEFTSGTDGVPGDDDASPGECFEVLPVTATLSTQAIQPPLSQPVSGPVPFGEPLYDKATLGGTAYQPGTDGAGDANGNFTSINATMDTPANGTIAFTLIGPDDCETVATGSSGTNPETPGVIVSGDGDYFSSGFTPDLPGDYHWQASYSGDSPNTLATTHNDDCDDTAEDVRVQQLQPTMSTAQSFIPNDSATITVDAGAGDLDGSLTFYLWVDDNTCGDAGDGPVLGSADHNFGPFAISDTDDPGDTTLSDSASTGNTTISFNADHDFYWLVVYNSNTGAHLGITGTCGNENSSITIDNGVTEPSSP